VPEQRKPAAPPAAWRQRLAQWLTGHAPNARARVLRAYGGAKNTRTTGGFGSSTTSADAELHSSLTILRNRSRQMVRDSAYAKRAKVVVVNNVIGSGVGMQAQVMTTRGVMAERINTDIETAFEAWAAADSCHTGGAMHFSDLERAAMGQVFEAGEVFIRKHYTAFGNSRVPLALELIEPERLAHELVEPGPGSARADVRMGVEVDSFGRALAYFIRMGHPGDVRGRAGQATERYERVPAADIYHLRIVDRWPQTRGEPWLHGVLRKLDDMNEFTGLEVTAARGSAAYFATVTSPEEQGPLANDEEAGSGAQVMEIEPLTVQQLKPGEELQFHTPTRPNGALDPFMRAMLREVSAGVGPSYESLSRDYGQGNYSSSRLALLDDRDLWRVLQQWWLRSFRLPLHKTWLQQAALAGALPAVPVAQYAAEPAKFEAVLFKPRGWQWVDPTKEVNAYKEAIKAGLTTLTDVIAQTGGGMDIEDVIRTRRRELDMLAAADIEVDTTVPEPVVALPMAAAPVAAAPAEPDDAADAADADAADAEEAGAEAAPAPAGRVLPIKRATA